MKKVKVILLILIAVAAVYSYRSEIKSFIGTLTEHDVSSNYVHAHSKSSYEYYYIPYTSVDDDDTSSVWKIYQEE